MREPELIIGYEENGKPAAAVCTMCGEYMPEESPNEAGSKATIARFTEDFKHHVRIKHEAHHDN